MNQKRLELADRVRAMLSGDATAGPASRLEEKRMFGSLAFVLDERLLVASWGDGDLLVRVDPEDAAVLRLRPGADRALMGAQQRPMGPGWLTVSAEVLEDDAELLFWIDAAREFHAAAAD